MVDFKVPRLEDLQKLPDALVFSDAAALTSLGGKIPSLADVSELVMNFDLGDLAELGGKLEGLGGKLEQLPELVLKQGRDFAVGVTEDVQRWIDYARDLPQFFEDAAAKVRSIAEAAIGRAGLSAGLNVWTSIVNTALQVQRERADANLRLTVAEQKQREAACLSFFSDWGYPSAWRSELPNQGQSRSVRDVGKGIAPTIAGSLYGSPFALIGLPTTQRNFWVGYGELTEEQGAERLVPETATEPRCDLMRIWRERSTCIVRNDSEDAKRDNVVVCTPWAWPLAVGPQWDLLGFVDAAAPVPDPELWLPVAGSYTVASPAHLSLRLERVLEFRELLKRLIAAVGNGWMVGPAGLQKLRPDASWPRYAAWVTARKSPLTNAQPSPEALQAALERIARVLAVRRWCCENFYTLPENWQKIALARNGDKPPPLGFKDIPRPPKQLPPGGPGPTRLPPSDLASPK